MQILPAFQVLEDRPLDFGRGGKSLTVEQHGFKSAKKLSRRAFVVAVDRSHRRVQAELEPQPGDALAIDATRCSASSAWILGAAAPRR